MRIFVKRENWEDGIWMRLPATEEEAEQIRRSLEEQHPSVMLPFIGAVDSRFPELEQRLVGELVYQEEKLKSPEKQNSGRESLSLFACFWKIG